MTFFNEAETLIVPETELNGCRGFALHIGTSTLKLVYIGHIEEHETLNPEFGKASLEMRSAPYDKLGHVIDFIKENLLQQKQGRHPFRFQAILTGWRALEYRERFAAELGVNIKLNDPVVSYTRYHNYGVCNIGRPTFLRHVVKCPAKTEPSNLTSLQPHLAQTPGLEGPEDDYPQPYESGYWDKIRAEFPYLLCAVGSDVMYLRVDPDVGAEGNVLHRSGYGGSMFHATASTVTGIKDNRELLTMANSGDAKGAGFTARMDNLPDPDTDCHFEAEGAFDAEFAKAGGMDKPIMIKPLDKVIKGEPVKQEDLVASLMSMTCESIVHTALSLARLHQIKKVYFAGAFVHNNRILEKCVAQSPVFDMKNIGPEMYVGLTSHSLYACALGALLDGLHMMQYFVECACMPPSP